MPSPSLTPDQQAEADRLFHILRTQTEADLRHLAELLASKADSQLLGTTEFEVRDRVHQIGAKAVAAVLDERKKRATTALPSPAPIAPKPPSSSAGKPRAT